MLHRNGHKELFTKQVINHVIMNNKGALLLLSLGAIVVLSSSKTVQNIFTVEKVDKDTEDLFLAFDKEVLFSTAQVQTLTDRLATMKGKRFSDIQIKVWRGQIGLDLENQKVLALTAIQKTWSDLEGLFNRILEKGETERIISAYVKSKGFEVSSRIYTIETNLINIAKELFK